MQLDFVGAPFPHPIWAQCCLAARNNPFRNACASQSLKPIDCVPPSLSLIPSIAPLTGGIAQPRRAESMSRPAAGYSCESRPRRELWRRSRWLQAYWSIGKRAAPSCPRICVVAAGTRPLLSMCGTVERQQASRGNYQRQLLRRREPWSIIGDLATATQRCTKPRSGSTAIRNPSRHRRRQAAAGTPAIVGARQACSKYRCRYCINTWIALLMASIPSCSDRNCRLPRFGQRGVSVAAHYTIAAVRHRGEIRGLRHG